VDEMWAKRKWAQKLRREERRRKKFKGTKLKELDGQQMRKKTREEKRRWN